MIFGKLLGAFFGFLLGGPFGFVLGMAIGHFFDKGLRENTNQQSLFGFSFPKSSNLAAIQTAFFQNTFLVMGYIAKSDGRVSQAEIRYARTIMDQLGLNADQVQQAIQFFNEGKSGQFPMKHNLEQLYYLCQGNTMLLQLFVELQIKAALADGVIHAHSLDVLKSVAKYLGIPSHIIDVLVRQVYAANQYQSQGQGQYQRQHQYRQQYQARPQEAKIELKDAYAFLGVNANADAKEIKKAYRKLISQHHPDKLIAKGLPENMIKLATEKTQKIQKAYEHICAVKGIN
jgi:DnaJ like chaperone protein